MLYFLSRQHSRQKAMNPSEEVGFRSDAKADSGSHRLQQVQNFRPSASLVLAEPFGRFSGRSGTPRQCWL